MLSRFVTLLAIFAIPFSHADFDGAYSLTPPSAGSYFVLAGDSALFGQWYVLPRGQGLDFDSSGSPQTLAIQTGRAARVVGGWVSFPVQASGTLRFNCTITGEGPGSVSWSLSNRAFQTVTVTDLPPHPISLAIPVLAGDVVVFDLTAYGNGMVFPIVYAQRGIKITNFQAPAAEPPRLTITRNSQDVVLSWPAAGGRTFRIESITSQTGQEDWTSVNALVESTTNEFRVTLPVTGAETYFRLRSDM